MKNMISITELARLRNVTTETLRHYDRIGLLSPTYRDENSGMRYYSLLSKDEKLGTIKELQQLGLSLMEIKEFLDERNLQKSYSFFSEKEKEIHEKIKELQILEQTVREKSAYLKEMLERDFDFENVVIKNFSRRFIYINSHRCSTNEELEEAVFELETTVSGINNALGIERFCILTPKNETDFYTGMFVSETGGFSSEKVVDMPSGDYVCKYVRGRNFCDIDIILSLRDYCKENNLLIAGNILRVCTVDLNVTDEENEIICELQIPVKK